MSAGPKKTPDKITMLGMFDDMPELEDIPGFRAIIERMPDDWDLEIEDAKLMASMEDLERAESTPGYWEIKTAPATAPSALPAPSMPSAPSVTTKKRPITIRVPGNVIAALREAARGKGIGYQTLMNRILKDSLSSTRAPGEK